MTTTFTKHNRGTDNLAGEAAGLRWLAQAEPDGGTHIAPVISVDRQELVIGRVQESSPTSRDAALMGASLAHMHAAGAPWWGAPPAGWPGPDWVGRSRTPLVTDQRQAPATWGEFYAQYRIDVFARRLRDAGTINSD
ncbi:MAG: fructosamine kinase, partial [Propionibacterium sp.]|nr:fructosamine kinase [Propionibacterium sp.]